MRSTLTLPLDRTWPSAVVTFVFILLLAAGAHGQSFSMSWNPGAPGSAGYYIYYGTNSGKYSTKIDVGTNTVATLSGLTPGETCYLVVTAYNSLRIESLPSSEVSYAVPSAPPTLAPQLAAVSPASGTTGAEVFVYGANLTTATRVQFSGVNAPFTVASDGSVIATVPAGAVTGPLAITTAHGVVSFQFVVIPASPPANDNFNNAQVLAGVSAIAATNTMGATKQSGEPNHAGNAGGSSVWYRWTAPAAGTWSLNTAGSAFTTLLAVYTGNSLTGLSPVANNLVGGVLTNSLTFTAASGVTYQIAVDGLAGASGNLFLQLAPNAAPVTIYSNSFEAAGGFYSSYPLAGQGGWMAIGSAATGIKLNQIPGFGQQAYIGFSASAPAKNSLLYVPLNYTVNTNADSPIQFSVLMQINAATTSTYNSTFGWVLRNASGHELFRISFDDYAHIVTYTLDSGSTLYPGVSFIDSTAYNLTVTMDFSRNLWSASLGGVPIATAAPISAAGAPLTLGDIGASDVFRVASQPGTDGMLFDNYTVTASAGLGPQILQGPANQTVAAGKGAILGALVSGAPPLSCQWYLNNNPISNATNAGLFQTDLTAAQSGTYSLLVTNLYGNASTAATLTVTNPPPKSVFAGPVSLGGGGAVLKLSVAAGNNYEFQASTNLHNWVTLGSFFAMSTNAFCFDPAAATSPRRFYRLVSP